MSFVKSKGFKYLKNLIIGVGAAVVLLGALFKIQSWQYASEMLTVGLPLSLVAAAFFLWRLHRIHYLFTRGEQVRGYITDIRLARDRGRVEFMFERSGQSYESWTPVHQNRAVLALRIGQEVDLLVDSARPTKAIIRHLYT